MCKELLAFKTKIYPTKTQKIYFQKCFGIRRFAWNWAIDNWSNNKSKYSLNKTWNNDVNLKKDRPYLYEVNSMVKQMVFRDIHQAWNNHKKHPKIFGEPKYKVKKKTINSFTMNNKTANRPTGKTIYIKNKWIDINGTRKIGRIKFKAAEDLEFLNDCRVAEWTISERNGNYFISVTYERTNHIEHSHSFEKVGIDAGVKTLLTLFDGKKLYEINLPKSIYHLEKKIKILNKLLSRKVKNSYRFNKIKTQINKAYLKIQNIRLDFYNKLTLQLAKKYKMINYESFYFRISKISKINNSLNRVAPYLLQELLIRKAKKYNSSINIIEHIPTTQTCSCCGFIHSGTNKKILTDRVFKCSNCNFEIGRDKNSAINIFNI